MKTIRVLHCNSQSDGWSADSPDLEGWSVLGASYAETKALAEDAVRARLADDTGEAASAAVQITHHIACSRE